MQRGINHPCAIETTLYPFMGINIALPTLHPETNND